MQDYFANLFRYVRWADRRVIDVVRAVPQAEAEALPLLAHLLAAEHVWLSRLRGAPARHAAWPSFNLDQCAVLADENATSYEAFIGGLDADALAREVQYRTTTGVEYRTPTGDILTHVATHGAYHRGQIAKAIGRAGGTAVNTDYITFVREQASAKGR